MTICCNCWVFFNALRRMLRMGEVERWHGGGGTGGGGGGGGGGGAYPDTPRTHTHDVRSDAYEPKTC